MECKYYRESPILQYTTSCEGEDSSVHEDDIEGDFCQFCGRKIKYMEYTEYPYKEEY